MNPEKLKKLQADVRIGGKGTMRRKHKVVRKSSGTDDKKLQATLKKLGVNPIQAIEEVNFFKEDGTVIHFNQPKVQANIHTNTYVVSGTAETRNLNELLPGILNQLGPESLANLKKLAESYTAAHAENDDEVPELVENFDEKDEKPAAAAAAAAAAAPATAETTPAASEKAEA